MQKKLDIPYYSQYTDVKDEYWKPRACGVLCLKSVLDFLETTKNERSLESGSLSADEFIKLAVDKSAYGKNGWIHQGLVDVAKDFGVVLKRKEFRSENKKEQKRLLIEGIKEIKNSLKNDKLVLVSVVKRFSEADKFHMIVLTGFKTSFGVLKGFYYNDTDYQNAGEGKDIFVDIGTFKKYWRRLAIFVE
ncbi:MAG: C39 family peptidase [Candidatus Pacebacteria bacterium]|nr:C39 family peptidase [Candidatus Paceibacterota bacterium]